MTPTFPAFPFGTHVYREPYADRGGQEQLLKDLTTLKRLGFTMIKIQESWAIDEPAPGTYDFSRIERLIARAQELSLGVYLGLTMEQAPAWLWAKFPDCRMVMADGHPYDDPTQYCLPADGKPGPCWDHPGVTAAATGFIAALAGRLGRFENIWCWNTFQEIGFWGHGAGTLGYCYCPHTLAAFRAWLKEKYTTLEALNRTWYTAYSDWDHIVPPRRDPAVSSYIDWRYFMDDVYMVRQLTLKTRALKDHDPHHRPVFCHMAPHPLGSAAEWKYARTGDYFGNSNYPAWVCHNPWDDTYEQRSTDPHTSYLMEMCDGVMMRSDALRCATGRDRPFWGAEFQGGPVSTHLHPGRVPTPEDLRRWTLAGLAAGMTGISYWNHRAEHFWAECNGFGLLDPKGDSTPRIEEASRIINAITPHGDLFQKAQSPRAKIALLMNEDLWHFAQATGNNASGLYSYNLRGHYARLWRLGYPVDFLDTDDVARGELSHYGAAILPMPLALDPAYFAQLADYVRAGGTLISEACPGRFDKYGTCPRTQMVPGAEELFGATHASVRIVREPEGKAHWTPAERSWGEFLPPTDLVGAGPLAGRTLPASFYLQTLLPTTALPLLMTPQGAVAGTAHPAGKGMAVLLGTYLGLSATAHHTSASDQFLAALLIHFGLAPERCGKLLLRKRIDGPRELWFLINPTAHELTETFSTAGATSVAPLLPEPTLTRHGDAVTLTVPATSITCLVLQR